MFCFYQMGKIIGGCKFVIFCKGARVAGNKQTTEANLFATKGHCGKKPGHLSAIHPGPAEGFARWRLRG